MQCLGFSNTSKPTADNGKILHPNLHEYLLVSHMQQQNIARRTSIIVSSPSLVPRPHPSFALSTGGSGIILRLTLALLSSEREYAAPAADGTPRPPALSGREHVKISRVRLSCTTLTETMLWSVVLAVTFTCCLWKTSKYSLRCLVRGAVNIALSIFPLSAVGLEVLLNPRHCICPNQNYTCDVKSGIGLAWLTNTTSPDDLEHSTSQTDDEQYIERGGFQVAFQRIKTNQYNSTLHVRDLGLNQTILTCEGSTIVDLSTFETIVKTDTTSICVSGNTRK